jgi:glycosyltransferase involved in cell wall biosynthesis
VSEAARRRPLLAITPFLWTISEDAGMPSAYRSLTGLAANGFDVHVLVPARGGGAPREYRDLHLHPFDVRSFGLRGDFGPFRSALLLEPSGRPGAGMRWKAFLSAMLVAAIRHGVRLARDVRPVVTYGILPTGALAAAAIGRRTGTPNVTRLFGTHLAPVHGLALAGHAWEVAAFKAPADLVIVTDDGTLGDEVARRLRVSERRLRFLMNGVDERFFDRDGLPEPDVVKRSLGFDPALSLFVFAHHLILDHHPDVLVAAASLLAHDGVPVCIAIAGDGPARGDVEEAVARAGLEQRVRVLGNVSRERIRELLSAATAVVSLDELSNLVNSVLEAFALGIPAVASATGGTRRLLRNLENALLVDRADPQLVAGALRRLVEEPALAAQLREGAAETARARLETWDQRLAREAAMIEELVL